MIREQAPQAEIGRIVIVRKDEKGNYLGTIIVEPDGSVRQVQEPQRGDH